MKQKTSITTGTSLALLLAFSAVAQDTNNFNPDQSAYSHGRLSHSQWQLKNTAKASDIIGLKVKNYQEEKLGTVADLAVDVESGRIVQVIISSGGFLGMGKTLTPVPPGALNYDASQKTLHLEASSEKFQAAPKCDPAKWDEDTQSNRVSEVYTYYSQHPYFTHETYSETNDGAAVIDTLPRNLDGTINTTGAKAVDTAHNVEVARNVTETNNYISTRNADGTWGRMAYHNDNRSSWSKLGYVQKASKLMGLPVDNLQNEKIGTLNNLIVDLNAGRIVAVIISSGGYIGINYELSAVPASALYFDTDHNYLKLDTTRQAMVHSPHFTSGQWPDFNKTSYSYGVYHAYNVEPYFNTDTNAQPDNTARNVRDRNGNNLTPLDQGNSQTDINTTAEIRKEIVAVDSLSMNAKNVKIITQNGHVTLRGPVNSGDEKSQIGDIANRIAQPGNVDNQLEVAASTTSNNN